MNKIYTYILRGQGLGIKFLLVLSLVFSLFIAVFMRIEGVKFIPYAQDIADQLLPIKVENGVVVSPQNTVKTAQLRFDGQDQGVELPFVIDTRIDTMDPSHMKDGIYMTRTMVYTVNRNQTKMTALEGSFEVPQADYRDFFASVLNWGVFALFIFSFAASFLFYFIACLFYAFCIQLLNPLFKALSGLVKNVDYKQIWLSPDFDQRMRLSVVCFATVYILSGLLGFVGHNLGMLVFFLIVILLQAFFLYALPLQNRQPDDKSPQDKE